MSFRLKGRRPIGDELSRLLRKEFKKACGHLASGKAVDSEAIHEARKNLKKIRATVRLLREELGSAYDSENSRLREAAHSLSALRDADASTQTLGTLQKKYPAVLTASIATAVRRGLRRRKRRVNAHAARLMGRARSAVEQSQQSVPRRVRRAGRWPAVRAGIAREYRRTRKAMECLELASSDAAFHLWRRRVKVHWYHVRLIEGVHRTLQGRAKRLKQLERWLGDEHNLTLLKTTVLDKPRRFGDVRTTALVIGCIVSFQLALRRRALALGHRLFEVKPADFRRSLQAWRPAGRHGRGAKRR